MKPEQVAGQTEIRIIEHETETASEWDEIYASLANKSKLKIGKMIFSEQDKSFMDQ